MKVRKNPDKDFVEQMRKAIKIITVIVLVEKKKLKKLNVCVKNF